MKKVNAEKISQNVNEILVFLENTASFKYSFTGTSIEIIQSEDQKRIEIENERIEKVLVREDVDGSNFLQINFISGEKILITKALIGFKPHELNNFDASRIPKVVTTVDLISVSSAIEELFEAEETATSLAEIEVLKKIYQSILFGAEEVGFKISTEKRWLSRIMHSNSAKSA